jgi:hypothetical protein
MSETRPAAVPDRVLPAAVSPLTRWLLAGSPRPDIVAGAHRYGVYVSVAGSVLPVLTRDALALPTALRLALTSEEVRWAVRAGDAVRVGGGAVRLPGLTVRGVRGWRPSRVRPTRGGDPRATARRLHQAAGEGSGWLTDPVRAAVTMPEPADAVADLVGRGRGLTPSGDDALAGALLAVRALGSDRASVLAGAVRRRLAATTAVSAALLEAAADGWAAPEVVALVDAAAAGHVRATEARLPPVLAIGHDSGHDLVAGLGAALDALATSAPSGRTAA